MAITPQHFAFITKYVAHFLAQSLLFPLVARTQLKKNARDGPFPQSLSHINISHKYNYFKNFLHEIERMNKKLKNISEP